MDSFIQFWNPQIITIASLPFAFWINMTYFSFTMIITYGSWNLALRTFPISLSLILIFQSIARHFRS